MSNSLKSSVIIGLTAMCSAVLVQSYGIKDWKIISGCASLGCFLGGHCVENWQ